MSQGKKYNFFSDRSVYCSEKPLTTAAATGKANSESLHVGRYFLFAKCFLCLTCYAYRIHTLSLRE